MTKILTINGFRVRGSHGESFFERIAGAPNLKLGATLSLRMPDEGNQRLGEITLPAALPSDINAAKIVWLGTNGDNQADNFEWHFPPALIEAMKAAGGTFVLAHEADLLGALAAGTVRGCRMVLRNEDGWGNVRDMSGPTGDGPEIVPFALISPPAIVGDADEGEALAFDDPEFTADPAVDFSIVWGTSAADDDDDPTVVEVIDGICPGIDGGRGYIYVGAAFVGPGAPAGIVWSAAGVAITPDTVETPVSVTREAIVASNQLALTGITGTPPQPEDTLTAGSATAMVVGYADGTVYLGEIESGPIAGSASCTWPGGSGTAASASAAWAYKAGEAFYILPPRWVGDGTPSVEHTQAYAQDSTAPDQEIELAGTFPAWLGTRYYYEYWDWTAPGVEGVQRTATPKLPIGIPTLAEIPVEDWRPVVEAEPGGGSRLVATLIHESYVEDGLHWTRSSNARLESVQWPTDCEPTIATEVTAVVDGRTFHRRTCGTAVSGGRDWAVFKEGDSLNLGIIATIGGARTPIGVRRTVPLVDTPPVTDGASDFSRFINRSQEQERLGEPGGDGMQYSRAWDAEGDYVIKSYDVTYPTESENFGDDWFSEGHDGLYISQTVTGLLVDGDYVHGQFGALFMQQIHSSYLAAEGMYRKLRSTGKWTRTKALPNVYGSNAGGMRFNMRYIAKVAGSGSGPATRTLFAIYAPRSQSGSFSTIQIIKSTNGGTSWADDGATLSIATHGEPLEIWADSTALYLNTKTRVLRRPIGGGSWTVATGLPSGVCGHLEKHGTKVYALVRDKGLYVANDAATLAFTAVKTGKYQWFSISPADTNRIVLLGPNPVGTHNNGSTWFDITSTPYPGQKDSFKSSLGGSPVWCQFHDTDPNLLVAMRFQHAGKSADGGKTFFYASRNEDYSEIRSIAFHRTDYRRVLLGMTDRLMTVSDHGANFVMDDAISDADKETIRGIVGDTALTARGCLILDRGTRTGYVCQIGGHIQNKVPVISSRGVTTTRTDQANTGNGAISVTASPDLPCGKYTLTCTAAAANGGTFTGVGPLGIALGTWTVGTARTFTHPRGGTLAVTISDGSVDFKAGANPCVITITVNPLGGARTILNPATKNQSVFGGVNPALGYRGFSGSHVFEMATDGSISLIRTLAYPGAGYMGPSGNVLLGYSGNSTLMRSTNEGVSWATFASSLGNFAGRGSPIIAASSHNDQRAYVGCADGKVKRIQGGTVTTIFDFDAWCGANGITGGWPGLAGTNVGRPPVSGVVESHYDPNLVYCSLYLFGGPYQLFRTRTALATTPVWENITKEPGGRGIFHPIQSLVIHPLTDEIIATSSHGNVMHRPEAGHRTAYNITVSMIADLRAGPGGDYHITSKI